jgi:hypothetical protein
MAECKLQEGIYLQTKKSTIGTGSTAKHAEYRNFWVTLTVGETHVEMILLDDAFTLTGIREKFLLEEVSDGPNWLYVEQGEKKYAQLKPKIANILNPPPKAPPAPKPGASKAAVSPLLGGKKPVAKPQSSAGRKDGWWNR